MDIYFEHFFIQKIRQGLRGYPPLSSDEEELLLTPISDLAISEKFSPDQATSLENKCVAALTNAYKEDTAGRNKEGAAAWAEHNKSFHEHSKLAISAIVQDWYLDVGRSLEKRAVRWGGFWVINIFLLGLILGIIYWLF